MASNKAAQSYLIKPINWYFKGDFKSSYIVKYMYGYTIHGKWLWQNSKASIIRVYLSAFSI